MANETNDFLTDWAGKTNAPANEDNGNDTGDGDGDAGLGDGELSGDSITVDNGDAGNGDDDSLTTGEDNQDEGKHVPLVALRNERQAKQEERTKREAAEKRVKELEEQLKAPRQPQQDQGQQPRREAAPPVDFWENPVGFVQQQVDGVRQEYEARAQQAQQAEFRRAENAMRKQHADFDEITAVVLEEAQRNPAIVPAIFQAENPAEKLYELGKQIRDFRDFQTDPQTARDKMREELKAEILAELKGSQGQGNQGAQPAARRPVDLSRQRNATSASATAPPDQFNELFKRG